MGNQEPPQKGEEKSLGSEDSTPILSQIRYELSDSANSTAKPAASKPSNSGAYNTNYNAAKHAAKVVSKEQFSLMDVHLKPRAHHKGLKDNLLAPIMFFSPMGDHQWVV